MGNSKIHALTEQPPQTDSQVQEKRDPAAKAAESEAEMTKLAKQIASSNKRWNRRLRLLTCCFGYKRNKDTIVEVANLMSEFFSDTNVSVSEVVAAFLMLKEHEEAQRRWILDNKPNEVTAFLSNQPIGPNTKFLDISNIEDSHLLNELMYYLNYALAIFGWPMSLIDDPCFSCCICSYLRLPFMRNRRKGPGSANAKTRSTTATNNNNSTSDSNIATNNIKQQHDKKKVTCDFEPIVLEDNCCSCNLASFNRRLRAHNYDVIYASYHVDVNVVPFLVTADHSKRTIVISIRGSMSIYDAVTDLYGKADRLPMEGCPEDWLCHKGIARAALYVKATIETSHVLDTAFSSRPDLGSQDYDLVLCGHSLGAGVATILGIFFRKKYPTLKAYLYAPPGGLLSLPAVEYTKQFATCILLGNDCVPRLGIAQLERLRYCALRCLKNANQSTRRVITKSICPSSCTGTNQVEYDPETSFDMLHCTTGETFEFNRHTVPFQVQPEILYVPGRLIHIVKNDTFASKSRFCSSEPLYQAIWTENENFDRIIVSDNMLIDHLPNKLMHGLKMLFCNTLAPNRHSTERPNLTVSALEGGRPRYESISEDSSIRINSDDKTHISNLYTNLNDIADKADVSNKRKNTSEEGRDNAHKEEETLDKTG